MPPVNPYNVVMTGENSFIRLSSDGGATMSSRLSHWRVLWCPDGAGHVLFIQSDLLPDGPRVYADNEAVARWLQKSIECYLFPTFANESLPVIASQFARQGEPHGTVSESITGGGDTITMTWDDCLTPFVLDMPPGFSTERPLGVLSTFFPARRAKVEINGQAAKGEPWLENRGDRQSSSACLAWSETWLSPAS